MGPKMGPKKNIGPSMQQPEIQTEKIFSLREREGDPAVDEGKVEGEEDGSTRRAICVNLLDFISMSF